MPSHDTTMELHGEQERARDIRTRLENLPHAFPQTTNYPVSWMVIYTLVYDCLRQLGLVNTLDLFMAESNAIRARPLMEEGWFLKSFVMNEAFHSMLIYLLEQFNQAEPRIKCLVQTVKPNSTTNEGGVCQAQDQVTESVREQVRVDSVLMSETQDQIREQMSSDCRVRGAQADQESDCRRQSQQAQEESVQQEREQQQAQDTGDFTDVCNRSRARIMDNFRESLDKDSMRQSLRQRAQRNLQRQFASDQGPTCSTPQKQDGGEFADICCQSRAKIMDKFRASLDNDSLQQQSDRKQQSGATSIEAQNGQEEEEEAQQFVNSVMNRSRGRILGNLRRSCGDNDSMGINRRNSEEQNLRKQIALRNLAMEGERVEWRSGGKTRPRHHQNQPQPQQQQNCLGWQQGRQSSLPVENNLCGGGGVDPRTNQSFRVMQRNQHTGWRMQPLPAMGPFQNNDNNEDDRCDEVLQEPEEGGAPEMMFPGYSDQCQHHPGENWDEENVLLEQDGQNPGIFLQAPRCEGRVSRRKKRSSAASRVMGNNNNCSHCVRRSEAWKAAKDAANGTHFSRWSENKMPRGESRRLSVASASSQRGSSAGSDSCNRPPWRF